MSNIPTSVMEDIEKRAEEKYPITYGPESNGNQRLGLRIQQNAYIEALCEAWEKMGKVFIAGYQRGIAEYSEKYEGDKATVPNGTNFLNQIFKK